MSPRGSTCQFSWCRSGRVLASRVARGASGRRSARAATARPVLGRQAGRGPAGSARRGRRCRWAGRRRGRRGPASRRSRPSTARCPGSASSARRVSSRSAPRSSTTSPSASARQSPTSARPRARGIGSPPGRPRRASPASGTDAVSRRRAGATGAVARRQPAGDGARARHRHLLAEHGPHGDLVAVDVAGHPQARALAHQRGQQRVRAELVVDRDRVAVGVEQPAAALDGGGDVAQVLEGEGRQHERRLPRLVGSPSRAGPCRCRGAARACVRTSPSPAFSTPGTARRARNASSSRPAYGVRTGSRSSPVPVEGCAPPATPRSSVGESGVDLADRVVELPDAGEAGRERDVGERHVGGLDEHAGGLRAPGAGQGERSGAELGGEQPAAGGGACSRPATRGPRRRRARRRRRRSAASRGRRRRRRRPTPGLPGVASGRQRLQARNPAAWAAAAVGWKLDVALRRRPGRARRPAVDARRADRGVEDAVEAPVPRLTAR